METKTETNTEVHYKIKRTVIYRSTYYPVKNHSSNFKNNDN